MLSIGAALLGSAHCLALDIDEDALETAQANVSEFEGLPVSTLGRSRSRHSPQLLCYDIHITLPAESGSERGS